MRKFPGTIIALQASETHVCEPTWRAPKRPYTRTTSDLLVDAPLAGVATASVLPFVGFYGSVRVGYAA
jgi:hypothetical protein